MQVELIAYTPNPDRLCSICAKNCYASSIPEDASTKVLGHAKESGHGSVLEHAQFTFAVSGISRVTTHQLVRHRHASFSQQSQRYVKTERLEMVIPDSVIDNVDKNTLEQWYYWTEKLLSCNVPSEDLRYMLPQGITTNIIVTMNARELLHFFSLRCCERSQWEIRRLAWIMLEEVQKVAPVIFEKAGAYCDQNGFCREKKCCGRCKKI